MSATRLHWPGTTVVSLAAALATWITLLAWAPFSDRSSSYLVPLLGGCALVAVAGALLRTSRLPALGVLLVQVVVVAGWLHHRWAGDLAALGWLPTPESLDQVARTLSASVSSSQTYRAPVPESVTEFPPMLIAAGLGTALLVDFLACGLRRAPVAGLPLLAAYTAPISIVDGGVSWLKFAAAALAFLLVIAAQESARISRWGQQVGRPGAPPDPLATGQAVWSSARTIGLSATGLAVLVPIIVPTLSLELFGGGNGTGGDGTSVSLSNPIVDMRRDLFREEDVDLVEVDSPEGNPAYLRISVLDDYDGETWRPSKREIPVDQRATGLLPRPPGLDADVVRRTEPWTVRISDDFESRWLPAPYPVYSITTTGDWRYDRRTLDFYSAVDDQSSAGMTYDLEAVDLSPTRAQLADSPPAPATVFGPGTELPAGVPDVVSRLAREATAGADDKYAEAVALQDFFRTTGDFTYSLDRAETRGNGFDDLATFLEKSPDGRVGYCEQFAGAMAVMSRSLGIPARVAVGFLRPEIDGPTGYVFSSFDLHAWPELYFEGTGWVRFEPTPGIRTGGVPAYTRTAQDDTRPEDEQPSAGAAAPSINRFDRPEDQAAADAAASGGGLLSGPVLTTLGSLLVLVALALIPRLARQVRRRRRWTAATTPSALAETAWLELRDSAVDLGISWSDAVTLRTRARELVRSFGSPDDPVDALARGDRRGLGANPEAQEAVQRLVSRLEIARFSRPVTASAAQRQDVESDLALCVEALESGASGRARSRAQWLPASVLRRDASRRRTRRGGYAVDELGVDHAGR